MLAWLLRRHGGLSGDQAGDEPSLIAEGVIVDGGISTGGELQIAGTVRGDISADLCYVDATASVEGRISAEEVHIHGQVLGPTHARRVVVYRGAHVEGTIVTETISIEDGAHVEGSVRRAGQGRGKASAPAVVDAIPWNAEEASETRDRSPPLRAVRTR